MITTLKKNAVKKVSAPTLTEQVGTFSDQPQAEDTSISGSISGKFKQINEIFVAIIVVLVLGFITLLVAVAGLAFAYIHDSQDTYRQSRDATDEQNKKIDSLIYEVKNNL